MKFEAKNALFYTAIIVFCSVFVYGAAPQSEIEPEVEQEFFYRSPSSNQGIIELYQELITLRLHTVEQNKLAIQYGRGSQLSLAQAEANLAETRIQLAEFEGKNKLIIKELVKLERLLTDIKNSQKREVDMGQRPMDSLLEIDVRLLETKIRLLKIKQEKPQETRVNLNESELRARLNAANRINSISMRSDAISGLAILAAKSGFGELAQEFLGKINNMTLRNQTIGTCAITLSQIGKSDEALELAMKINSLTLKNEVLMKIATSDLDYDY